MKNNLIAEASEGTTGIGSLKPVSDARAPEELTNEGFLDSLELYLGDIIGVITILATLFFIVYAFLAAFEWVTAGGDSSKITKARDRLIWSTLGLILVVATYAIIGLIGSLVGVNILEPAQLINSIVPGGN